jgi:acetyl esterase/lipase
MGNAASGNRRSGKRGLRAAGWIAGSLLAAGAATALAFKLSPWPASMLIRSAFTKGAEEAAATQLPYVPSTLQVHRDIAYRAGDHDARLDVFSPVDGTDPLPTIVWVHGGGWVSGSKNDGSNYMSVLAARGFTVVNVGYSIAPEKKYPLPVEQVLDALAFLDRNAASYRVNPNAIVLAGDSAGSPIAAQVANIVTSPEYAAGMGLKPTLAPAQLAGIVLYCGAYDMSLVDWDGHFGGFLKTIMWAYTGSEDVRTDHDFDLASVLNYVTPAFPATFISAGNADPLAAQSRAMAAKLQSLGCRVQPRFFADDDPAQLGHEYQAHLDKPEAREVLALSVDFVRSVTAGR